MDKTEFRYFIQVLQYVVGKGYQARLTHGDAGHVLTVRVPDTNIAVQGLIPIDVESRQRFADYILENVDKLGDHNHD